MSSGKKRQQEVYLEQLRQLIPGVNSHTASKSEVMAEAARYIEQLQNNLIGQIRTHGYPEKLKSCTNSQLADDKDSIRRAVESYVTKNMK